MLKHYATLLAAAFIAYSGRTSAQTYTVDNTCTTTFEDISTTGTALGLTDDGEANVTAPFSFTFFGVTSSDFRVGNNGGILFNATTGDLGFTNATLPNTLNLIAPLWDDIGGTSGNVFWEVKGTAPFRRLIVQWHDRQRFSGGTNGVTFQVKLYEFTNVIDFKYQDVFFGGTGDAGSSATVGINANGVGSNLISFNTASLSDGQCIRFIPDVAPANDLCASATALSLGNNPFHIFSATGTDESSCGTDADDVWFSYTATSCGTLILTTCNLIDFSSTLSAFDGCGGVELTCSDMTGCPTDGIDVAVSAGQTYLIRIGDAGGLGGSGFISASLVVSTITALCQNVTVDLDANGDATVTAAQIDNGTVFDCGIASMTLDITSFTCADLGTNTVELSVTGNGGPTGTCTATVTVQDVTAPTLVGCPTDIEVCATGLSGATVTFTAPTADDNCSATVSQTDGSGLSSGSTFPVGTTTIEYTATDAAGLTDVCSFTVTVNPQPQPNFSSVPACDGDAVTFSGSATISSGSVTDLDWDFGGASASGSDVSNTFPGPGTFSVTLTGTSDLGCTGTFTADATVFADPVADFSATTACLGTATVFTDLSSGATDHVYDLGDGNSDIAASPSYTYGTDGDFSVTQTVTSSDGCTDVATLTVTVLPAPVPTFSSVPACDGDAVTFSGSATISSGSITDLDWDFGGASASGSDVSNTFPGPGTFSVTLTATSDLGCTGTFTADATVFADPVADFSATTACLGTATVFTDLSSGATDYIYDLGDGNSSNIAEPAPIYAADGSYNVTQTVTSSDGCTDVATATVEVIPAPAVGFTATIGCVGVNVDFTNTSDAGTYAWDFDNGDLASLQDPSTVFATSGTYNVSLTVTAGNGCEATLIDQVVVSPTPDFNPNVTDVSCFGGNNGAIIITPTVGTPDIFYTLNGGTPQLSQAFFDLSAGSYTVGMSDATGCSSVQVVPVGQPGTSVVGAITNITNVTCHAGADGSFTVAAGGGTSPYTYSINGGTPQLNPVFTGLAAGFHDVTVIDANGCTFDTQAELTEPQALVAGITSVTDVLCNGDATGAVSAQASGGSSPYTFSLNNGPAQSSGNFGGLTDGNYSLLVTDNAGCTDGETFTINEPSLLLFSVVSIQDVICNGTPTGYVEVGAASGTPSYTYSLNGSPQQVSGLFSNLVAGQYSAVATDANGCQSTLSITIDEPAPLTIQTVAVPATCGGQPTGQVQVSAAGGTQPYVYSSDGGQNYVNNSTLVGLLPGNYTVLVADDNGCTASESVTITGPADPLIVDEIVDDIECPGFVNGAITLNPSGGTAPYQYSFNNGAFSDVNMITDLNPGPVSWAVVDANGCLVADFVMISDPNNPIQIAQMLINDPLCQGDANGTVTVIAFGGAGGYSYSLDGQTFQSDNFLVGYQAGFYNLTIMDANGCTYSEQIELVDPTLVQIAIESIQNTQCSNEINGAVTLSATGGNPTYLYALEDGPLQVSNIFNVLSAGTYTVYASDLNGCVDSTEVTIFAEGDSPVPSFNPLVSGEAVQFINTSLFGTSFFWEFGDGATSTAISPIHTYAAPGDYLVTLTVTNECGSESITVNVSTVNIGITEGALADMNLFPNPGDGHMTVTLGSAVNGPVALQVTDLAGRGLYSAVLTATGADGRATLDLSHLAKGTYLLTFSTDGALRTLRAEIR